MLKKYKIIYEILVVIFFIKYIINLLFTAIDVIPKYNDVFFLNIIFPSLFMFLLAYFDKYTNNYIYMENNQNRITNLKKVLIFISNIMFIPFLLGVIFYVYSNIFDIEVILLKKIVSILILSTGIMSFLIFFTSYVKKCKEKLSK